MWLPVILLREFGWAGWVVFAVPNVAGAAVMGLVLRRPGASQAFLRGRMGAARWFSRVTIAFQIYFCVWVWTVAFGRSQTLPAACFAAGVMFLAAALARLRRWDAASVAAWAASAAMLAAAFIGGQSALSPPPPTDSPQARDALFLALSCVFGFTLCPYLDLTFHRVRQHTPGASGDAAFVLGFGVLFLAMITGTLVYASALLQNRWLPPLILAHIALQAAFTAGAHARELSALGPRRLEGPLCMTVGLALGVGFAWLERSRMFVIAEDGYTLFMACYGLVFPAWVWIVARPIGPGARTQRRAWLAAVILAAPAFALGFLGKQWWWLAPGVGSALLARPLAAYAAYRKPPQSAPN